MQCVNIPFLYVTSDSRSQRRRLDKDNSSKLKNINDVYPNGELFVLWNMGKTAWDNDDAHVYSVLEGIYARWQLLRTKSVAEGSGKDKLSIVIIIVSQTLASSAYCWINLVEYRNDGAARCNWNSKYYFRGAVFFLFARRVFVYAVLLRNCN